MIVTVPKSLETRRCFTCAKLYMNVCWKNRAEIMGIGLQSAGGGRGTQDGGLECGDGDKKKNDKPK